MLTVGKFLEGREKWTDVHFGVHTGTRLLNINTIRLPQHPCEVRSLCGSKLQTLHVVFFFALLHLISLLLCRQQAELEKDFRK